MSGEWYSMSFRTLLHKSVFPLSSYVIKSLWAMSY